MAAMDGRVVVVTGSTSGIGEAIARRFNREGATVVINSATSVEAGERIAAELGGTYVQADIGSADDARRIIDTAVERHGGIDVLVNNAGTTAVIDHRDLEAVTDEIWQRIIDVNLTGTWRLSKLAAPVLAEGDGGSIVNVTSVAGLRPLGSSIPYAVSKAALNHLTVLLAKVLGPQVRVNAVAPGLIETPWTSDWDDLNAAVTARAPAGRVGVPADVAEACLALTTSTYVTGQVLAVDGGIQLVL